MTRVPAHLVLVLLRQSGHHIGPATLRQWIRRGHITRGDGGYDLREIKTYLDRRSQPQTEPESASA